MSTTDNGTYLEVAGRPAVRFERIYSQPVEQVWHAVTDPAEMQHWFPSPEVSHDRRTGGSITLAGDPYAPEPRTSRVLRWDPPHGRHLAALAVRRLPGRLPAGAREVQE